MALTQISTAGVKDDAVTSGKIPANAVGSSELADNAVDTAAIVDDAVNNDKIANSAVNTNQLADSAVHTQKINDDAVTTAKLANSIVNDINANSAKASITLNNNADNRVITGSGTANTLEGEANLTFTSDVLQVSSTTQGLGAKFINTGNEYTNLQFSAARTGADQALGIINAKWDNNHEVAAIYLTAGDDTSNKDDGKIKFYTSAASGSLAERVRIDSDGLKFNGDTAAANALDDYEEGTFTPVFANGLVASSYESNGQKGVYTKIGRYVYGTILLHLATASTQDSNVIDIHGLPFTAGDNNTIGGQSGGAQYFYQDGFYNSNEFAGIVVSNTTRIRLYKKSDGTYLTGSDVNGGREIRVDFSYHAA